MGEREREIENLLDFYYCEPVAENICIVDTFLRRYRIFPLRVRNFFIVKVCKQNKFKEKRSSQQDLITQSERHKKKDVAENLPKSF